MIINFLKFFHILNGGDGPVFPGFLPYFLGSQGTPLKGELSVSSTLSINFLCSSSSVVSSPLFFLSCSQSTFCKCPYVSRSNSSTLLLLSTVLVSISLSPTITLFQIASYALVKLICKYFLSSIDQKLSSTFIFSHNSP